MKIVSREQSSDFYEDKNWGRGVRRRYFPEFIVAPGLCSHLQVILPQKELKIKVRLASG